MIPDTSLFSRCAFVCIDIQDAETAHVCAASLSAPGHDPDDRWDDALAATGFARQIAFPNARRVADACRLLGIPRIFLHWGFSCPDGMDLAPEVRRAMLTTHGPDFDRWPGRLSDPRCRPAALLGILPTDYVLAKTGQDAFTSSNLGIVVRNLEVRTLLFAGGSVEACLGRTVRSAVRRGYAAIGLGDASYGCRESTRHRGLQECGFDLLLTTDSLLALAAERLREEMEGHIDAVVHRTCAPVTL